MATRQITLSDLSGEELNDETHTTVIVKWPDVPFRVRLDLTADEAGQLADTTLRLAEFEIHRANAPVRTARVELKNLEKVFPKVAWEDVVAGAPRAETAATPPSQRARTGSAPKAASTGDKKDYSGPYWGGTEHRGRVTEAEAEWVRNNLEAANANRAREGQEPIDLAVEKYAKRYGIK